LEFSSEANYQLKRLTNSLILLIFCCKWENCCKLLCRWYFSENFG
jgi:hypothetical protein